MKQYVCLVCGYVHTGDEPPEICPISQVPKEKFIERPERKRRTQLQ